MSVTRHRTHANDNPLTINRYDASGRSGETAARRLAAALPRGAEYVREVENAPLGPQVWIEPPQKADTEMVSYLVPDGFSVEKVSHFSDGTICVRYGVDA